MREDRIRKLLVLEHDCFDHCDTWNLKEDSIERLIDAFFDRAEHCNWNSFPSLRLWRKIDENFDLTKYDVYVDKENIKLVNPKRAAFIGKTNAEVYADINLRKDICLQHGASADITTAKYGLIAAYMMDNCKIKKNTTNGGKILIRCNYE